MKRNSTRLSVSFPLLPRLEKSRRASPKHQNFRGPGEPAPLIHSCTVREDAPLALYDWPISLAATNHKNRMFESLYLQRIKHRIQSWPKERHSTRRPVVTRILLRARTQLGPNHRRPFLCNRLSRLHDNAQIHSWEHTDEILRKAFGNYEEKGLEMDPNDVIRGGPENTWAGGTGRD